MRQALLPWSLAAVIGVALVAVPAQARGLTFEDRIAAQQAIARVYYAHQVGATLPFEEAVPRELLEKQVLRYLEQSKALEARWNTPITAEVLHAELQRMARGTRMPERLLQLYDALGNDPVLIGECLARPILVDRLARNFFAYDERLHTEARQAAESLRAQVVYGELDPLEEHPQRTVAELSPEEFESGVVVEEREAFRIDVMLERSSDTLRVARYFINKKTWDDWWSDVARDFDGMAVEVAASSEAPLPSPTRSGRGGCGPEDTWINGSLDDAPDGYPYRTAVWTGSRMVVWGGGYGANTGSRYDPATDSWTPTSTSNAPAGRTEHTAVWTGSRMVIWGGEGAGSVLLNSGGLYDPETDSWSSTSTVGVPAARKWHSAVWTGSHMVVWGGGPYPFINSGSRYDPEKDSWSGTSTANAPSPRGSHSAVWTGSHMIVWGGQDGDFPHFTPLGSGGRYDPETDSWTPTSSTNAPLPRVEHTAVWTGTWMVVWGGDVPDASATSTGSRYDPLTDSWSATSAIQVPLPRRAHTAVWTGDRMAIWGGIRGETKLNTGGRYDPQTNTWTHTSIVNAPSARWLHRAVWTGSLMIVWGGFTNSGGRYDPLTDAWTPTFTGSAPAPRARHTAVWTGNHMVVWGGESGSAPNPGTNSLNSGGRYDPVTDGWTPMSTAGAPAARNLHTAIWSGDRMVVWGGAVLAPNWIQLNSGGRYDPVSDTWTPTSLVNVPSARDYHTAVWTGTHMIVWGGRGDGDPVDLSTGGRYDPTTDIWTPTSTFGAPSGREKHTAVWTGSRMLVWGGDFQDFPNGNFSVNSGGIYDPLTDSWTATAPGAPQRRGDHTAVWTGSRMVVWGGVDFEGDFAFVINSGGSYDPERHSWTFTSMVNVPSPSFAHTAVWSGSHMIVWGGLGGGHYDPATNVWTPVSTVNAPEPRGHHSAVLTEDSMLVWGGSGNSTELASGGQYVLALGVDNDGDGLSECLGDCTDTDPTVFDVPAEIEHLRWPSPETLAWDSDAANSGTGTRYDLMYGSLADVSNFGTGPADTCMADDISQLQALDDSAAPDVGEAWFFLVRGGNVCGNGRWETASDGGDRLTTVCP